MFFGQQGQSTEMSAMVSALAHVVSGQRVAADWGHGAYIAAGKVSSGFANSSSSADSPSGSGSSSGVWVGQKRGRGDETSAQLIESAPRGVQRTFADFRADTSSPATSVAEETTSIVAPVAETTAAASNEETGERRRKYRGVRQRPWGNGPQKYGILTKQQEAVPQPTHNFPATQTLVSSSLPTHFQSSHPTPFPSLYQPQALPSSTADMLRDYWQYSQLLQSSAGVHGQQQDTCLMEQMIQSSQLPIIQQPLLSSSLSPFPSSFVPSSSSASAASSSSSAYFPLPFAEHQQMSISRQPSNQTQASGQIFQCHRGLILVMILHPPVHNNPIVF
ncbi:Detected protein of unknown function [Hibiscus syriacus]|uniref:Uncharacterized protein n=1 Tax=Hibiscus syriacus TaxID=106335 RepID=A0A6A3AG75_HIBSY|nr:Detected protein of unknown function [Hibiscus syriacus]